MICFVIEMFSALNSVTLLGRVGSEPVKKGTDVHPVIIFSLATHTNYRYDSGTNISLIILK